MPTLAEALHDISLKEKVPPVLEHVQIVQTMMQGSKTLVERSWSTYIAAALPKPELIREQGVERLVYKPWTYHTVTQRILYDEEIASHFIVHSIIASEAPKGRKGLCRAVDTYYQPWDTLPPFIKHKPVVKEKPDPLYRVISVLDQVYRHMG